MVLRGHRVGAVEDVPPDSEGQGQVGLAVELYDVAACEEEVPATLGAHGTVGYFNHVRRKDRVGGREPAALVVHGKARVLDPVSQNPNRSGDDLSRELERLDGPQEAGVDLKADVPRFVRRPGTVEEGFVRIRRRERVAVLRGPDAEVRIPDDELPALRGEGRG